MKNAGKSITSKLSAIGESIKAIISQITPKFLGISLLVFAVICTICDYPAYSANPKAKKFKDFSFGDCVWYPIYATGRSINRFFSFFGNLVSGSTSRGSEMLSNITKTIKSIVYFFGYLFYQIWEIFTSIINFFLTFLRFFEIFINFSKFLDDILRRFSQIFMPLQQILKLLMRPILHFLQSIIPFFKKLLLSFSNFIKRIFNVFLNATKNLATGTSKAFSKVMQSIGYLIHKLPSFSIRKLIRAIASLVQNLFGLLGCVGDWILAIPRAVFWILSHFFEMLLKIFDKLGQTFKSIFSSLFNYVINTLRLMKNDLVNLFSIFGHFTSILDPIINAICSVFEFIKNVILYIIRIPSKIILFIIQFFAHPFETIKSKVLYFIDVIGDIIQKFFNIFNLDIFRFISNCAKTIINGTKNLIKMAGSRLSKILYLPKLGLEGLFTLIKNILNLFVSMFNSIVNSISKLIKKIFSFKFSLRALIDIILTPFRIIIRALEKLSHVPVLSVFCSMIRGIVYMILWAISFVIRIFYFIISAFMSFFSNNYSLDNIFDMWDNVCWPRDAEYCKKVIIEQNKINDQYNYQSDYVYDQ